MDAAVRSVEFVVSRIMNNGEGRGPGSSGFLSFHLPSLSLIYKHFAEIINTKNECDPEPGQIVDFRLHRPVLNTRCNGGTERKKSDQLLYR